MYGKMQESGLIEIISLIRTLAIQGQNPDHSYSETPQGVPLGMIAGCTLGDDCRVYPWGELGTGSPLVCILNALWAPHWGQL